MLRAISFLSTDHSPLTTLWLAPDRSDLRQFLGQIEPDWPRFVARRRKWFPHQTIGELPAKSMGSSVAISVFGTANAFIRPTKLRSEVFLNLFLEV